MENTTSQTVGPPPFGAKDAAEALNDQGFLFQQLTREKVQNKLPQETGPQSGWVLEASEYPVVAADGTQTRIDLILGYSRGNGIKICIECKRPNPKYKTWLFFDRDQTFLNVTDDTLFLETGWTSPGPDNAVQRDIDQVSPSTPCPAFNYYLEGERRRRGESASSTDTIEKSLRQLMTGHSGLMAKFTRFSSTPHFFRVIPVLVTTADLLEVEFSVGQVSPTDGTLREGDVKLKARPYCAITYHADDTLAISRESTNSNKSDIRSDLLRFQTRTAFVVHATAINAFLNWAGQHLTFTR